RQMLQNLLVQILETRKSMDVSRPVLVKIAPDLTEQELYDVLQVSMDVNIDGIVATNTTISRPTSLQSSSVNREGGLSGKPLYPLSLSMVQRIYQQTNGELPIIAAGGIFTGDDVLAFIQAGAS